MREPSHDNRIATHVAIRSHGPEANTQSLDFPPIAFPRCQDHLVAPRLQTQRESHIRVQVAERAPRRDENSPLDVIRECCDCRTCGLHLVTPGQWAVLLLSVFDNRERHVLL